MYYTNLIIIMHHMPEFQCFHYLKKIFCQYDMQEYAQFFAQFCNGQSEKEEFDNICEDWYSRKHREEAAKAAHKKVS